MSPQRKARLIFASALTLLLIGGAVAGLTIARLIESARWVSHTYEVKLGLGEVGSALSAEGRARTGYALSGSSSYIADYESAKNKVPSAIENLRQLIGDSPVQQSNCDELQTLVDRRAGLLDTSMGLEERSRGDDAVQAEYSLQLAELANDYNGIMKRMQEHEQNLLDQRIRVSGKLLAIVVSLLFLTFALAIILLWMHYRFLTAELKERERAELSARSSEDASRRLSARVLQLQDEERRRFSRELHDSLGQSLTVAKMIAEGSAKQSPLDKNLPQLVSLLDESLSEIRTISYLLHPPLLDELGLVSAAKWYVEGFAKRSGVQVVADIPDGFPRLARATELAFFRALQESLTNIHRHSKCTKADVLFQQSAKDVSLIVKDNGRGVPREILERFESSGTHVGVGLAGMRERIREQGGSFTIHSNAGGTTVWVTLPTTAPTNSDDPAMRGDIVSL